MSHPGTFLRLCALLKIRQTATDTVHVTFQLKQLQMQLTEIEQTGAWGQGEGAVCFCNYTELYADTYVYITGNTQNNGAFQVSSELQQCMGIEGTITGIGLELLQQFIDPGKKGTKYIIF